MKSTWSNASDSKMSTEMRPLSLVTGKQLMVLIGAIYM